MAGALPLAGIRVLDLTQVYNGPYATFLMAMAGAEVIKVEPPGGEYLRRRDANSGAAVPFAMLNACKDSVSLNLKAPEGRDIFLRLAETADVVAENYAPGVMDRLGIGWTALSARNPRLILASGSGYGQEGPYRDLMAMDLAVQAMSGLMSITGEPDGPPMKAGAAMCDFAGGIHLYGAIVTALFQRMRTGQGERIDVAMMDSVYMTMASNIGGLFGAREDKPLRTGNRHGGLSLSPYNVYATADGHIAITSNTDRQWAALARVMGREDLIDTDRTRTMRDRCANMDWLDGLVTAFTTAHGTEELAAMLRDAKVPAAPVRRLPDVMADEALRERGMLRRVDHPVYGPISLPGSPLRRGGVAEAEYRPSPAYARDNARIYGEIGFGEADLARLAEAGVL